MLSKSQFKLITSLAQKKYRLKHQLFIAEGKKAIFELLNSSLELHSLYTTEDIFEVENDKYFLLKEPELKKISRLSTPQTALALFQFPEINEPKVDTLVLALDGVRDPGNLGTIIRLCDWFGIKNLICSEDTVDCYNPKVVQATMGSIARVNIFYTDLPEFLQKKTSENAIFGSFMDGKNVYQEILEQKGILVMGNEANGISPEIESIVSKKISIPRFSESTETESLNVATATAILLSEFRRRK
ncbi:MAG TPA: RNA methyltransferase [Salinimicrobium sp.]|nr:RNA methyltransferase [Salinimicrobium sp.]